MNTLRFKFYRGEELRFISHLDQLRLFQRAFRRAEIPLAYSQGFNPHPKIAFAQALSVGITSDSEYCEIKLESELPTMDFTKRLNGVLPTGISILEVWTPEPGETSLSASLKEAVYIVNLHLLDSSREYLVQEGVADLLSKNEIFTEKRNKRKKIISFDLRPFIKSITLVSYMETNCQLEMSIFFRDQQTVKPQLVVKNLNGVSEPLFDLNKSIRIHRKALLL